MNDCSICLNKLEKNSFFLPCNHEFHFDCIKAWINIKPICPLCSRIVITKFKIYKKKYKFFKHYKLLEIKKTTINFYNIKKKNKIIVNKLFFDKENLNKNKLNKNLLNNNELKDKIHLSINVKKIKKIQFSLINKYFYIYYKNTFYKFNCKRTKIKILFDIIKKMILEKNNT